MFYVKHYDVNGRFIQDTNIGNLVDLEMYKDIQMEIGETILVYCDISANLREDFEKKAQEDFNYLP